MPPKKEKKKIKRPNTQQPSVNEDLPHPSELQVLIDGVPRRFTDYTREFTRRFYPDVARQPIMVPPLVFHQNWLVTCKDATKELQSQFKKDLLKDVIVTDRSQASESTRRSSVAEYRVAEAFRHLAGRLGGPSAIFLTSKFENYLHQVKQKIQNVRLPSDILKDQSRGEHDLLFVRPADGVLIVSVKSVGGNFDELQKTEEERKTTLDNKLHDAIAQLKKEHDVVEHVLSDLSPPVTSVIGLPNISRGLLTRVLLEDTTLKQELDALLKGDSSLLIICSEELHPLDLLSSFDPDDISKSNLAEWFKRRFPHSGCATVALSPQQYEDIIGRYCGLFSIVDIPNRSKSRVEVRCLPDAVREVNRRFRSLILLPGQASLLCSLHSRVYLYGLMGSGKSVMLRLKARHWLTTSCDVIILNVGYDAHGSPMGHALLRDVLDGLEGSAHVGKAALMNVRLTQLDKRKFLQDIYSTINELRHKTEAPGVSTKATSSRIPTSLPASDSSMHTTASDYSAGAASSAYTSGVTSQDTTRMTSESTSQVTSASGNAGNDEVRPVHFVLDEVYPAFQPVFDIILKNFPQSNVWAAGLEVHNAPPGFHTEEMTTVLRNPPTVQTVLRETDYEPSRRTRYTVCGAAVGLPAEGPTPRYIHHRHHHSSSSSSSSSSSASAASSVSHPYSLLQAYSPLQCKECAIEVVDIFKEVLGLPCSSSGDSSTTGQKASSKKQKPTPPSRLSFKDIVVLVKDPEQKRVYPKVGDVYKLDTALFGQFVTTIDQSAFVRTLRDHGCRVRTVTNVSSADLAFSDKDEITVSWINPASGLEWAVVVFMPGDPPVQRESSREEEPEEHTSSQQYSHPSLAPTTKDTSSSNAKDRQQVSDADEDLQEVKVRMSERDRKYLFWGASRCTAQLIVLVP